MARAYSQSQQRFIDIPDQTGGGGMGTPTPTTGGYGGGDFLSGLGGSMGLQKALILAALSDPKHTSNYSGISTLIKGMQPDEKAVAAQNEQSQNISDLDRAIASLTGGMKTGPISGRTLEARVKTGGIFGSANQSERQLYNLIGKIQAEKLFSLGGKTLPAQEIQRLLPFVPSIELPTETNLTNLDELRKELIKLYGSPSMYSGGGSPGLTDSPDFQPEE